MNNLYVNMIRLFKDATINNNNNTSNYIISLINQSYLYNSNKYNWNILTIAIPILFTHQKYNEIINYFMLRNIIANTNNSLIISYNNNLNNEKLYEIIIKSCYFTQKYELIIELFIQLLNEKKVLSAVIFEVIIELLCKQITNVSIKLLSNRIELNQMNCFGLK